MLVVRAEAHVSGLSGHRERFERKGVLARMAEPWGEGGGTMGSQGVSPNEPRNHVVTGQRPCLFIGGSNSLH